MSAAGRGRVESWLQPRIIHSPTLAWQLTMRLRDGTGHTSMNSGLPMALVSGCQIRSGKMMKVLRTAASSSLLVSSPESSSSTSSTSVTIGPIYALSALRQWIPSRPLARFPMGRSPISVGVRYRISTVGPGAQTMERLRFRLILS